MLSNFGGLAQLAMTAICGWIWWSLKKRFTPKEEHTALRADHGALEKRVTTVETVVGNLPTMKDHSAMIVKQTEMGGDIKRIEEGGVRQQKQLDRIEEYLIRGGK